MERYRRAGFWSWFRRIFWLRDQRGFVAIPVAIWIIFGVAFFGILAHYDKSKNIPQPVEVLSQSAQEMHDIDVLLRR